jgi:repressor LexA
MDLTEKQKAVFDFIKSYRASRGRAPSYMEIQSHFRFKSLNSVQKHLKQLERKGFLRSPWGNQKRAIQVVDKEAGMPSVVLPLAGTVVAGRPLEVAEVPDSLDVPESYLGAGEHFALRVRGDRMEGDGIQDGDLLVVRKRETAEEGQTVVALVDGEATVKRYFRRGAKVELRPANPAYESIVVKGDALRIQGVVVALLRRFS